MLTRYQLKAEREFPIHICQLPRQTFFTEDLVDQVRNIMSVIFLFQL